MTSNRQVFIAKSNVAYGASLTSATTETATNPSNLRAGAIGVFYFDSSTNNYILMDATHPSANHLYSETQEIIIAQGTASGTPQISSVINGKFIEKYSGKAYTSPVKQVVHLFYDGTSGAGIPIISNLADGIVGSSNITLSPQPYVLKNSVNVTGATGDVAYTQAKALIAKMNLRRAKPGQWYHQADIISNGDIADTWTGKLLRFTEGSTTVEFMDEDTTAGYVASTGSVTAGDRIGVGHSSMISVTFTADVDANVITIDNTIYTVADAGSTSQNATAIAAAINAGTQATATVSTADVTIVMRDKSKGAKITAADLTNGTQATLTINTTIGSTTPRVYEVVATTSSAATFELTQPATFSGIYLSGVTEAIHVGVMTIVDGTTKFGIKLTANTAGERSEFNLDGDYTGYPIYYTTDAKEGSGTSTQVAYLENMAAGFKGIDNPSVAFPEYVPRFTVDGEQYAIVTIVFSNKFISAANQGFSDSAQIHIWICLPTSSANDVLVNYPAYNLFEDSAGYLNEWANSAPISMPKITAIV